MDTSREKKSRIETNQNGYCMENLVLGRKFICSSCKSSTANVFFFCIFKLGYLKNLVGLCYLIVSLRSGKKQMNNQRIKRRNGNTWSRSVGNTEWWLNSTRAAEEFAWDGLQRSLQRKYFPHLSKSWVTVGFDRTEFLFCRRVFCFLSAITRSVATLFPASYIS